MDGFDLTKYLQLALRRRYWIIVPFLITILGGMTYALITPRMYEAKTLILVQPQKVPQDFVRSIVAAGVDLRLRTITQQVTSRTNLERIIKEYGLYAGPEGPHLIDDKVQLLRENVLIDVSHQNRRRDSEVNAFTVSYVSGSARKAMEVTNALASNFISENLKIRESQAIGTSTFLADELDSVRMKLAGKEKELKDYREKYMGGLPEQLDTNLRILERLQGQFDQIQSNLRDAENRRMILQKEIADNSQSRAGSTVMSAPAIERPTDLEALKNQLAALESKYTPRHPDIIRLKEMISKMEAESDEPAVGTETERPESVRSAGDQAIMRQLAELESEIGNLRAEVVNTKSEISRYQAKVEETPKREQELLSMNRDYENIKESYNSLLNRKLEAEIAVSMEKKQQGEQFRVIDPAKIPQRPIKPDMRKIILLTIVLGIGLGGGLAFLVETMDSSYKTPEEVEKELGLAVLVTMPIRYTEKEIGIRKRKEILRAACIAIGFVFSVIGILFATNNIDDAMNYVKTILPTILSV